LRWISRHQYRGSRIAANPVALHGSQGASSAAEPIREVDG
jgi:hypothetical protein